jgi:tetratricopeptide (TPR) repeat protein
LFEDAVAQYDLWITGKPKDDDLAAALEGRCRARALWNRDLDQALADCNEAIKLRPGAAQMLDSRGLVRLRQGQFDPAISDFNEALRLQPSDAWSLYGRGLAESRKGMKAESDADIAAAAVIAPNLAARAKGYDLAP